MTVKGYDIVGDIHGHANALHRLLIKLGYAEDQGVFRHSERTMIFVGDFIDRGPDQREVVRIVRSMCEAGAAKAVMGNHEFNAIGWAARGDGDRFLREHSCKNTRQHLQFLRQIVANSAEHRSAIEWFMTLPVWLELPELLPELRLVHACWHEPSREALLPHLDRYGRFTAAGLRESYRKGSTAAKAADILLKGPEERLPQGLYFHDKDGHRREEVRLRWWDQNATTFRKAALGMDGRENEIPDSRLPTDYRYHESKPVFFGHYWLEDQPLITAPNAACLDFSVAKGRYLAAYRWSGKRDLAENCLVSVSA